MELVPSFAAFVQDWAIWMSGPSFVTLRWLVAGWLFATRRTVTGMIQAADAVGKKHHSAFHRFFASGSWCLERLGLTVFDLMSPWLERVVFVALDDTLARKRGRKVFGAGMHHDPLLSTRKTAIMNWGHSWVIVGVLLRFPFRQDRVFCLPVLFRLYLNRDAAIRARRVYRTRPELAVEMLHVLCQHGKSRHFHVVADTLYGGKSVLRNLPDNCDLTTRIDLDARLYAAPPARVPGTNGRPRTRGMRLPSPRKMLSSRCRQTSLHLYGRRDRVRIADVEARWHCITSRPLRVVAVESLTGGRPRQAFYSTCHAATAEQILTWYAERWAIEQTFQEAKGHLGFEEPQGWTRRAVERTAPFGMLLYSLIVLWFASVGHHRCTFLNRPWYPAKRGASFTDMLATLRAACLRHRFQHGATHRRHPTKLLRTLEHVVTLAA